MKDCKRKMDRKQARDEIYSGEEKKVTVAVKERRNLMAQVEAKGMEKVTRGSVSIPQYHSVRIVRLIEKSGCKGRLEKGTGDNGRSPTAAFFLFGVFGVEAASRP